MIFPPYGQTETTFSTTTAAKTSVSMIACLPPKYLAKNAYQLKVTGMSQDLKSHAGEKAKASGRCSCNVLLRRVG